MFTWQSLHAYQWNLFQEFIQMNSIHILDNFPRICHTT